MTQQVDKTISTSKTFGNAAFCRRFEPRTTLEACVRGFLVRRVEVPSDSEHLSRFPATASCSLSWFLEGSAVRVSDEQSAHARIVFRGPPLDVLPAPTDEDRVKRIEKFLEPRWHAARSRNRAASWGSAQRHGDWSRAAILRAHLFAKGRSRRQLERQMRAMTGWSARELRGLARAEDALLMAAHCTQAHVNWASISAEAGYADQSHLCRELRRYTGFSPQQLWRRAPNEEDLWVYKAWFGWSGARDNILHSSEAHS